MSKRVFIIGKSDDIKRHQIAQKLINKGYTAITPNDEYYFKSFKKWLKYWMEIMVTCAGYITLENYAADRKARVQKLIADGHRLKHMKLENLIN